MSSPQSKSEWPLNELLSRFWSFCSLPSQLAECALSALLARFEKRSWLTVRTEREENKKGRAVSGSRGDRDGQKGRPAVTHTFNDFRLIHNRGPSIEALLGKPSIIKPGEPRSFWSGELPFEAESQISFVEKKTYESRACFLFSSGGFDSGR